MSADGIIRQPTTGDLAAYAVGKPVSATHIARMAQDVGYLLGQNTQTVIAQCFAYRSSTNRTIKVSYTRNPGVSILLVEAEPHKGSAVVANGTITVTSSAGTIAWASPAAAAAPFNGTVGAFVAHSEDIARRRTWRAYLDVTGLAVGTTYDLNFAWADNSSGKGIAKLTVLECPISSANTVDFPTSDIGMDIGAIHSGLGISTNTTTSARGMARMLAQYDKCRTGNKRQWQVCTSELDADAFQTSSGSYATMMAAHSATNPTWRWRAQRHYTTTGDETMVLGWRYRVSGGATAALQILVDGVATQSTGLTSATYTEVTKALLIPCSGATDQEVTIQIQGRITSGAGTVYLSRARVCSNQS